jgi:DNA-binding winged helix-turn-helix (wHTH) protein
MTAPRFNDARHHHRQDRQPDTAPPQSLAIGPAVFLPASGLVILGQRQARLRPKTVAVLSLLLEHAGRVLPREKLLQEIWPGAGVTDDNLTQSIGEIRRALGPDLAASLRTIPARGYMLAVFESVPSSNPALPMPSLVPDGEPYESRVRQLELRVVQLERLLQPGTNSVPQVGPPDR